ncbi:response regulator transcription factor [Flagellimonas hymeniacidonis]|uniref:Response regulator transcription factor n=1 Tax=Flagellimonas hymeniacidonis TaxID=2603628 RepID=A0A5C8VAB3_9FLAO|nr:response regulator transcription factor [Flagellimonas hymeniacidonis]TXN38313.1 response regulator transcription factor [Flagellimonas hymeniacidonis]
MKATLIIVDDEPHARRYILSLLQKDIEIEILGECKNGREALELISTHKPDIILLDIQMPGISGIDVADSLKNSNSIVIFTTAYNQYALKAFETEAFNYLLKPFDEKRFFEVINRAKSIIQLKQRANFNNRIMRLFNDFNKSQSPQLTEFKIKDKGLERVIKISEVVYLEARSVYIIIHTKDKDILYRAALNLLEQQLPANFLRIHRSQIINLNEVTKYKYLNNNTFDFIMSNDQKITSSRSYKNQISNKLMESQN